jgi:hypothetical protein
MSQKSRAELRILQGLLQWSLKTQICSTASNVETYLGLSLEFRNKSPYAGFLFRSAAQAISEASHCHHASG